MWRTRPYISIKQTGRAANVLATIRDALTTPRIHDLRHRDDQLPSSGPRDAFYILLPLLIVLSTFLFLLLLFLICVILLRRRRGIMLRDHDGPVDMSREDLVEGEGGFDGVESRWLESVNEPTRRTYLRAKGIPALHSHTYRSPRFSNSSL